MFTSFSKNNHLEKRHREAIVQRANVRAGLHRPRMMWWLWSSRGWSHKSPVVIPVKDSMHFDSGIALKSVFLFPFFA